MAKTSKVVTAQDVAQAAGVSQATVSYVLSGRRSGKPRISDETRRRVLDTIAELGYVPNQAARSLRRQRTERVCVMLPNFGAPSHNVLVRDIQQAADRYAYTVIITVASTPEREQQVLDQLRRRLADGVILVNPTYSTAEDIAVLARANLAVVVLSNQVTSPEFDVVCSQEVEAFQEAVSYLLDRGHRRIAFLGYCADQRARGERLEGYRRAFLERGLLIDETLNQGSGNSREEAYRTTRAMLEMRERPTAIFAASDMAAISAIWAVRDAGLRIPEDVAIIGVGNIREGEMMQPALTTVGPATLEFTHVADLLFSRLAGDAPAEGRVYQQRALVIHRGSA
jgi:DNA-binding LacI/PurR family transcriptional regulator